MERALRECEAMCAEAGALASMANIAATSIITAVGIFLSNRSVPLLRFGAGQYANVPVDDSLDATLFSVQRRFTVVLACTIRSRGFCCAAF